MPIDQVVPSSAKFCPHSPLVPEFSQGQPTGRFGRMACDPFACEIMDSCKGINSRKALFERLDRVEKRLEDAIGEIRAFLPKLKGLPVVGSAISSLFGG